MRTASINASLLQKQVERDKSVSQPVRALATDYSKASELKSWKSGNPWYGRDYAKNGVCDAICQANSAGATG
jgi:hypothetical protein